MQAAAIDKFACMDFIVASFLSTTVSLAGSNRSRTRCGARVNETYRESFVNQQLVENMRNNMVA
jgi:hypothetical protein